MHGGFKTFNGQNQNLNMGKNVGPGGAAHMRRGTGVNEVGGPLKSSGALPIKSSYFPFPCTVICTSL